MLNYIWAGLIISSFVFALGYDVSDLARDRYRNGRPLPVALAFPQGYDSAARRVPVEIRIDSAGFASFYGTTEKPAGELSRLPAPDPRRDPAPLRGRRQAPRAARHDRQGLEVARRRAAGRGCVDCDRAWCSSR